MPTKIAEIGENFETFLTRYENVFSREHRFRDYKRIRLIERKIRLS